MKNSGAKNKKRIIRRELNLSLSWFGMWGYLLFFIFMFTAVAIDVLLIFKSGVIEVTDSGKLPIGPALLNIMILALVFTGFYIVARRFFLGRPMEKILEATEKVKRGEFNINIPVNECKKRKNELDIVIDEFNVMLEELRSNETLKTDFIANVSHEIKTPLAIIESNCAAMLDDNLDAETRRDYLQSTVEGVRRLSALVSDVLRLNKLENQKIFPEKKEFDLSEQLRLAIISTESVWDEKNIRIECDIPDECLITSDSELLEHIWLNLIGNALKFTPEGGKVAVELKDDGGKIFVSVEDNGCGICDEDKGRVFEKFYCGKNSGEQQGNGLGLALVSKIAAAVNAEILLDSEQGRGSRFTVVLHR